MEKKAYTSPATMVTVVNTEMMIAQSSISSTNVSGLGVSNQSTQDAGVTTAGVKNGGYNVWSDDWSE